MSAVVILLHWVMLLASCSHGSSIIVDPDGRTMTVEQAHQDADAHLSLAAQALAEALAEAEAVESPLADLEVAAARARAAIQQVKKFANAIPAFAEAYWPWPWEAWTATRLRELEEAEEALTALSEVGEKAATQARRVEDTARYSVEFASESAVTIQALAETFRTGELRAALKLATEAVEKARKAVANAELVRFRVAASAAYAAAFPAELEAMAELAGFTYFEEAGRHHARLRAMADRIAALAMETDPDEFPYAHEISSVECPSYQRLENLPTLGLPDLGGGWTTQVLKTHSSERLVVFSHSGHLHFGWWLTAPQDPEDIRFDAFTSGDNPLLLGDVKALTGTATYEGLAAGTYVKRPSGTGYAREGVFAATVTLTADFRDPATIGGAVRAFMEYGSPLGAWTVELRPASLEREADAFRGAIGGAAAGRAWNDGNWTGSFFGPILDGSPVAVLGEFHAVAGTPQVEDRDTGFIGLSGAFGAHAGE